jgi:hypothetical protein
MREEGEEGKDQVEGLVLVSLLARAVAANRRDVQHPRTELDKGTPLDGEVQVGDVSQSEVDDLFDVLFAKKRGNRLQSIREREMQRQKGRTCLPISSPSLKATNPFSNRKSGGREGDGRSWTREAVVDIMDDSLSQLLLLFD